MPAIARSAHTLTAYQVGNLALPIVPAPAARDWMSKTDRRFANRCLPMLIANQSGWLILNNAAFSVVWSGSDDVDALSVSYDAAVSPPLAGSFFGYGIVTWSIPFVFRTPPDFNLLVRGPANSPKDGVCALEGIVESDWASSTFTMNWKVTRPRAPVRFEIDEPICMIAPQRRGELEHFAAEIRPIATNPEIDEQHRAWALSREQFLRALDSHDRDREAQWQRDYFQGRHVGDTETHRQHQTRLQVQPFSISS